MKALTILQPWATLIATGQKRVENRTWSPPKELLGGYLGIHAGKRLDSGFTQEVADHLRIPMPDLKAIPMGAIIAVGVLDRIVASGDGDAAVWDDPFFSGPWGWYLRDVVAIEPVPCAGLQKLWNVPASVLEQVRANWRKAARRE